MLIYISGNSEYKIISLTKTKKRVTRKNHEQKLVTILKIREGKVISAVEYDLNSGSRRTFKFKQGQKSLAKNYHRQSAQHTRD